MSIGKQDLRAVPLPAEDEPSAATQQKRPHPPADVQPVTHKENCDGTEG